ncbi:mucosal pentraxin-like [Mycteria americana]|uniref:mucosal pentraxin-like n=1 Tax=Mycteria americana TaxID=33587 RepID=UPI003F583CE7
MGRIRIHQVQLPTTHEMAEAPGQANRPQAPHQIAKPPCGSVSSGHLGMKVTGERHHCVATLTLAQTLSSPRATAQWGSAAGVGRRRCDGGVVRAERGTLSAAAGAAVESEKVTAQIQPPAPTSRSPAGAHPVPPADALLHPARLSPQEFLWEKEGSHSPLQKGPNNILLFPSFNETHLGTYVCTATGSLGTAMATYNLRINDLVYKAFVFPQETKDSHVLVRAKLEQPLQNFTVCLRSYTDLTRPYSLFYATKVQDNEILLFKPKPSEYQLYVGGRFVSFSIPKSFVASEHVCTSWESTTGIVGFWFNGKPWPRKGLQRGYTVGAEAAIVLGQEQDAFGGGFDTRQSYMGEISSVYMWDTGISTSGVRAAKHNSPDKAPIFGWRNFPYKIVGEVYLKP